MFVVKHRVSAQHWAARVFRLYCRKLRNKIFPKRFQTPCNWVRAAFWPFELRGSVGKLAANRWNHHFDAFFGVVNESVRLEIKHLRGSKRELQILNFPKQPQNRSNSADTKNYNCLKSDYFSKKITKKQRKKPYINSPHVFLFVLNVNFWPISLQNQIQTGSNSVKTTFYDCLESDRFSEISLKNNIKILIYFADVFWLSEVANDDIWQPRNWTSGALLRWTIGAGGCNYVPQM